MVLGIQDPSVWLAYVLSLAIVRASVRPGSSVVACARVCAASIGHSATRSHATFTIASAAQPARRAVSSPTTGRAMTPAATPTMIETGPRTATRERRCVLIP